VGSVSQPVYNKGRLGSVETLRWW